MEKLPKQNLGNSDLELSNLGLGTWAIGGDSWTMGWGKQSRQDSIYAIHEALDAGINWIDTAPAYGFGEAELVVAEALQTWENDVIVATKCGILEKEGSGGDMIRFASRATILKEVEESLKRLRVECIDLYQIHWAEPAERIEEAFQTLLDLKQAGKVRWVGVCNYTTEQLQTISQLGALTSLQPLYNLLDRGIEETTLPWCQENNCGVIVYSPMQSGIITDKVSAGWVASLEASDWRKKLTTHHRIKHIHPPFQEHYLEYLNKLREIAARSDHNIGQLAIAWTIKHPQVTAAIVGARKKGQISDLISAGNWEITAEDLADIELATKNYKGAISDLA